MSIFTFPSISTIIRRFNKSFQTVASIFFFNVSGFLYCLSLCIKLLCGCPDAIYCFKSILNASICLNVASLTLSFMAFLSFWIRHFYQSFLLLKLLLNCLELVLFDSKICTNCHSLFNSSSFTYKLSLVSFNCLSNSFSTSVTFTNGVFNVLISSIVFIVSIYSFLTIIIIDLFTVSVCFIVAIKRLWNYL